MNSCLYESDVMHQRLEPKKNRFLYHVFMFYVDLAEIDALAQRLWFFSRNRFNVFAYWDKDHIDVEEFVRSRGVETPVARIMLLTHMRTLGHVFNPVSFYFCFDAKDKPLCAVVEVENTFHEKKPYLLGADTWNDGQFHRRVAKNFYVSPFMELDIDFDFRLKIPGETLQTYVDDYKGEKKVLLSSLTGRREPLTNAQLVWYAVAFPLITLKIIGLIHWQAFILWLKRVPHIRKAANPHLQEVYHGRH